MQPHRLQRSSTSRRKSQARHERHVIPVTEVYTYLGFAHTRNGIQWDKVVEHNNAKGKAILDFLQLFRNRWSEVLLMQIYKTFVRSRMEYGGQAIYHMFNIDPQKRRGLIEQSDQIQSKALTWITGIRHNDKVLEAICDFPAWEDRLYALAVTFHDHINRSATDHPIHGIARRTQPPYHDRYLIDRAMHSQTLKKVPQIEEVEGENITQHQAAQLREYHRIRYYRTILGQYILPICRRLEERGAHARIKRTPG